MKKNYKIKKKLKENNLKLNKEKEGLKTNYNKI
jgi:hypothetical protein